MSLVEDFKDRVPTQVLSNGAIRYEEFDENGNSLGYRYIKRADEPIEQGNVWNKAIYDGIKEELAKKLLISNKSTTEQANSGTDDTTYMTPLKVKQSIIHNRKTKYIDLDIPTGNTKTTFEFSNYITEKTRKIEVILNMEATASADGYIRLYYNDTEYYEYPYEAKGCLEIYPKHNIIKSRLKTYNVVGATGTKIEIDEIYNNNAVKLVFYYAKKGTCSLIINDED